jgi:two-component system nitrogen regulation sensor histidine kinase NtrY
MKVKKLDFVVSEFLLFAKPPQDNIEIIQLDHELAEMVTLFENDCDCRDRIDLTTELVPGFKVAMDPVQLRQVLWNLLLNAVEAIEGSGRIEIKMYSLQNAIAAINKKGAITIEISFDVILKIIRIEVSDSGKGISDEEKTRLFEPYFSTKKSGMGLGLAIVNSIISDHKGMIRVQDNKPEGAKFIIEIPA